jgi:exo-beta-1,3-glucanase (GH17 family)
MRTARVLRAPWRASSSAWVGALVLAVTCVLAACGGSGEVPATQPGGKRALPADFGTRKAVNYSPFRTDNRDTEVVTRDNIVQDLGLLVQGGFTLIRTFSSSEPYARLVLEVIRDNRIDMKVQLGIYILTQGTGAVLADNLAFTAAEVEAGIQLANEFKDIVVAVSVGNEAITFGYTTVEEMAGYLSTVRARASQPLTTNDTSVAYSGLAGRGGEGMPAFITNLIDYASIHMYPILFTNSWDWEQQAVPESERAAAMMDAAVQNAIDSYDEVRKYLNGQGHFNMPIVVGETGWKAVATSDDLKYRAHPANQKMYYDRLVAWGDRTRAGADGPAAIFYFEAFDEPWKAVVNPDFNDDNWGLFNVERQARFVIQNLFPANQWAPGNYTLADAVYAPTVATNVITADRYTVYADAVTPGEAIAPASTWFGFDDPPNAFAGEGADAALAFEGLHFMEIGPAPSTVTGKDYGWGVLTVNNVTTRVDLSQFQTSGRLNFSIRTTYPGKLMFGFGTAQAGAVFVVASNTNADGFGYINDGQWHQVSIPVSAFTAAGEIFDLSRLTEAFVIADIYDRTGNAPGSEVKVFVDAVYWSK